MAGWKEAHIRMIRRGTAVKNMLRLLRDKTHSRLSRRILTKGGHSIKRYNLHSKKLELS